MFLRWISFFMAFWATGVTLAQNGAPSDSTTDQASETLPQKSVFTAEHAGTTGIVLDFDANILPAFLQLMTIVEGDTLYDYIRIEQPGKSVLKTIAVKAGVQIEVEVRLFQEIPSTFKYRAKLTMDDKIVSITSQNQRFSEPEGDILLDEDVVLLRYVKKDFGEEHLILVCGITPGFPYSELLATVKVVTQRDGVLEENLSIPVQWGKTDPWQPVRLRKNTKIILKNPGTYFIRIQSLHADERLNGVDYISFETIKMN